MNAPCDATAGGGDGDGENRMAPTDGEGTITDWLVDWNAVTTAGRKYEKPPATADRAIASAVRVMVRKGLRRPRDARARCPGLKPSGTGNHFSGGCGLAL